LNVNCNVEQHVATASTPDMDKTQCWKCTAACMLSVYQWHSLSVGAKVSHQLV